MRLRSWIGHLTAVAAAAVLTGAAFSGTARAQEPQNLVDRARVTIEDFRGDPDMAGMRQLIRRAKGVMIIPQLLKAGFIIGGEGGSGILLTHRDGIWSPPAFYNFGAGSIGLQIGAQASEVVLLLMTDRAIEAVLRNQVKLGADASVAAGPVGIGIEAATTTNLGVDVYTYARSKGLFAGASLEGSVISPLENTNQTYYGRRVTPRDIVLNRAVDHAGTNALRASLDAIMAAR